MTNEEIALKEYPVVMIDYKDWLGWEHKIDRNKHLREAFLKGLNHKVEVKSVDLADVGEPEGKYCQCNSGIDPKMICWICEKQITEDP